MEVGAPFFSRAFPCDPSIALSAPPQHFWVLRPAGDWLLLWGAGHICVLVSAAGEELIDTSAS